MSLRKALLVGINAYRAAPLRGCINDVLQMRDSLQRYYGFTTEDIRLLLDEEATARAIKAQLQWLAQDGADPDAVRVFHYSGHGGYIADQNGDEPDGRDECLVPCDHHSAGMLTDDTLKTLYDRFPRTGNLTLVMDCCHSGSIQKLLEMDVVYRFLPVSAEEQRAIDAAAAQFAKDQQGFVVSELLNLRGRVELSEEELRQKVQELMERFEKRRFGDIRVREANLLLAGCRPDQQAADAPMAGGYHGAFTYFLVKAVAQSEGQITYRQLAEQVGKELGLAGFVQIPQLEYRGDRHQRLAFRPFS
jgi:hypothetical protein